MTTFFEKLKKGMGIKNINDLDDYHKDNEEEKELVEEKEEKSEKDKTEKQIENDVNNYNKGYSMEIDSNIEKNDKNKDTENEFEKIEDREKKMRKKRDKEDEKNEKEENNEKNIEKDEKIEKNKGEKLSSWLEPEGQLAVDVFQTEKYIVIQSAIAGIKSEDLDINVSNDVVFISGKRERNFEEKEINYFYKECYWGKFSREVILPVECDTSKIEATLKNGILTIKIPKAEKEKLNKIAIK